MVGFFSLSTFNLQCLRSKLRQNCAKALVALTDLVKGEFSSGLVIKLAIPVRQIFHQSGTRSVYLLRYSKHAGSVEVTPGYGQNGEVNFKNHQVLPGTRYFIRGDKRQEGFTGSASYGTQFARQ